MVRVAMVVTNACAPDPRVLRHATWMHQCGIEVTVHAFDREEVHPLSENIGGVRIMRYRAGVVPYGGTLQTYRGIRRFHERVIRTLENDPPSLVYCHDADTLRIGELIQRRCGLPFVFDMHDLQHSWIRLSAPQSKVRRFVSGRMKQRMLNRARKASAIITSSGQISANSNRGFVEWLDHHGLEGVAVENRPLPPYSNKKTLPDSTWTVGYVGRVRDMAAMESMIGAVKSIGAHERPRLLVAGDGVAAAAVRRRLMDEMEAGELEAEVIGAFTQEELPEIMAEVDVMFAMYAPLRGNILQGALPVKMFDAAACGIPSVVNDGCLMGDVVEQEQLGIAAPWSETERIGEALLALKSKIVELRSDGEREHQRWLSVMKPILDGLQ